MPGLVGILGAGAPESRGKSIRRMVAAMAHEPSYVTGVHEDPDLGVWLGWAVHAGSFSDALPVWNERRDRLLIFVGEHFADDTAPAGPAGPRPDARRLLDLY